MAAALSAPWLIFDFGHSHYHSTMQNISEQTLKITSLSFLEKLRSLCERLPRGLDDDAEGARAAARVHGLARKRVRDAFERLSFRVDSQH